jgi:hypothetical protein
VTRHLELSASDDQLQKLRQTGILLTMNVPLKQAGPYQIRASVRDGASAAMGSAGQYIEVPDLKKQHFALTTPLLKEAGGNNESEAVSPAVREFHAGSSVSFVSLLETDHDESAKIASGNFAAGIQLYCDGKSVLRTAIPVVDVQGQNVHAVKGELRLKDSIAPGQYDLEVTAILYGGKVARHASGWIDFQVIP